MNATPFDISVIIPCRNEEKYIRKTLERVLSQKGRGTVFNCEIIVVDGRSYDGTLEVVKEEMARNPSVKLIVNNQQITPAAFNLGIQNSAGRYVCILGAHCEIEHDYLIHCLETMEKSRADNVGGPWKVKGDGYMGEAIALAFQSPFSSGGAKSHDLQYEGYLDSVWGGFYKREVFEKVGFFDEELVRNQDDEFNYRLMKSGGKIWQSPKIRYHYICRKSLKHLFLQYIQYGYWKVRVIQKHKLPASIRHLVPASFLGSLMMFALASPFSVLAFKLLVSFSSLYVLFCLFSTFAVCSKFSLLKFVPVLPFVFAAYHFGYGFGFLRGMIEFFVFRRGHSKFFSKITRG